jgi:hypothetical protein
MNAATHSFSEESINVASVAKLNAAPGLVAKVSFRKSPSTRIGSRN